MNGRIGHITGIDRQKEDADRYKNLSGDPADHIIDDRGKKVDHSHTSKAEYDQSFRADPTVEIQEIIVIIPPLFSPVGHLQLYRGQVFHRTCQNDGKKEFHPRVLTEPVQEKQDHCSSHSVDGQPGTVQDSPVDKPGFGDQMEADLPGPADKTEDKKDGDDRKDGITAKITQVVGRFAFFVPPKRGKPAGI